MYKGSISDILVGFEYSKFLKNPVTGDSNLVDNKILYAYNITISMQMMKYFQDKRKLFSCQKLIVKQTIEFKILLPIILRRKPNIRESTLPVKILALNKFCFCFYLEYSRRYFEIFFVNLYIMNFAWFHSVSLGLTTQVTLCRMCIFYLRCVGEG